MNRTAQVINMLHILYGKNTPITRVELAQQLNTNARNIVCFKKELEAAGYEIISTTGKYGGYLLNKNAIFPSLSIDNQEMQAINEALLYMEIHADFPHYKDFQSAMNKLKARTYQKDINHDTVYLSDTLKKMTDQEKSMIYFFEQGKERCRCVEMEYCSNSSVVFSKRVVHPYEIISSSDGYYVLAYEVSEGKEKEYKFFKIVEERMRNVKLKETKFTRDIGFKLQDYIGKQTLMKELYEVKLRIKGINARLVNESKVGNVLEKHYEEGVLYLHFMMEGKMRLKKFILSMGSDCEVLFPTVLKEEIKEEMKQCIAQYK